MVLVHGVHMYICLGLQVKSSKALVKAFKDDTGSYCLSALANAAVDCLYWFRVLCPGRSLMLNSLVGGVRELEKGSVKETSSCQRERGRDSSVAWVMPNPLR